MSVLTPRRRRGVERLDESGVDPRLRVRSLGDVARSNTLFGGRRALLREIDRALPTLGPTATLLDVGTGLGDLAEAAAGRARRRGITLVTIGLDLAHELLVAGRERLTHAVVGNALRLPLADRSVDLVACSQLLHHFPEPEIRMLIAELDRVARVRVIIGDLRRSWIAAAGFWLASFPLRFHPVTRHDGVVSVLRGFTSHELGALIRAGAGVAPSVRRRLGWRITASWVPRASTTLSQPHGAPP